MRGPYCGRRRSGRAAALLLIIALVLPSCGQDADEPTSPPAPDLVTQAGPPGLSAALAAQARHTDRLLATEGVVGTAVGLAPGGRAAVQVFTKAAGVTGLPASLDGVPVSVIVTGEIRPIPASGASPGAAFNVYANAAFPRPVPIGVSVGNQGSCSAGTIGARVKSGNTVYILGNNHVLALRGAAPIGSNVLQPGRADLNCAGGSEAVIGTLKRYVPITFSTSASNKVDAAIAVTTTSGLGRSTPADGYGTPSATIAAAALSQPVQKYGRTTGLTTGSVVGVNATINVAYDQGVTRFVGQIMIVGRGQFSRSGDSGSLIVTNGAGKRPIGLLFAGSTIYTWANPIDAVLQALGVTIDGS